jgi:hypothetical protein
MGDLDANKIVRWVVALLLFSFVTLGASAIYSAFKPKPVPTEALSNEPVDFSAPASARMPASSGKSKITSADAMGAPKRPALPKYSGDEPRPYVDTRSDGGSSASSPIFNSGGDQSITPLSGGESQSGGYGGGSESRDPSSVSNKAASGGSDNNLLSSLGGLASSLLGGGSTNTSSGSSGSGSSGGGNTTSTTTITETSTTFIGTTGGGGYNGTTTSGFKVSVSIGVPLSKLEGSTQSGNYKYQVNLTGQQVQ